ncbi:unnamed protein product [Polarella glacialis]|uniref:Cytochrome P450 n=1 Tax=Polarella glacialis TaxID=89957 RepID=A0A813LND3_POLGL|nr:unnamed protein product [Polarella glacialis]
MCVTMCACGLVWCTCALLATLLASFGLIMVPGIEQAASRLVFTHLSGKSLTIAGNVITARHFTYCLGDYLGCVKDEAARDMVNSFTWETGIGEFVPSSPSQLMNGDGVLPLHFSHAAYRDVAYDLLAGRPPDMFVFSNKTSLPAGVMPDFEPDILLNLDTGSEEHANRRKLIAEMLPALAKVRSSGDEHFRVPTGVEASAAAISGAAMGGLKRKVFDTVGYNLFDWLFEVNVENELAELFEYDGTLAPIVLGIPAMSFQGRRMAEIRMKIFYKVTRSRVGKAFMRAADDRGMDGEKRLSEMVWIAMFAGYGGSSNLAFETIKRILTDPGKYTVLFRSDPKAFMLEAARLHPPVGGMNPMAYRKETYHKLATGKTIKVEAGQIGIIFSSAANKDPQVFRDPYNFVPGRENAERLLSWNNEWGDFSRCSTVAGCPEAPRGCPGTFLSMRLVTATVDFFVGGIEGGLPLKQEL